jgi:hypothetical protein
MQYRPLLHLDHVRTSRRLRAEARMRTAA